MTKDLELEPAEVTFLTLACRQADNVAQLEKALADGGTFMAGSTGQARLNPIFAEVRAGRLAVEKLLGRIALPEADTGAPQSGQSRRAQHAANVRWIRQGKQSASG